MREPFSHSLRERSLYFCRPVHSKRRQITGVYEYRDPLLLPSPPLGYGVYRCTLPQRKPWCRLSIPIIPRPKQYSCPTPRGDQGLPHTLPEQTY